MLEQKVIETMEQMMGQMQYQNELLTRLLEQMSAPAAAPAPAPRKGKGKAKTAAAKAPKDIDWSRFEPRKDEDGHWNWRSYKAARTRFLEATGYGYEAAGWMSRDAYEAACAPFVAHFGPYVRTADR